MGRYLTLHVALDASSAIPYITPDTPKTVEAAALDSQGNEDDADFPLASSEDSHLWPRGSDAASVSPQDRHNAVNDVSTVIRMLKSRPQCATKNTTFLSGWSLACCAREGWTQYTAKSRTSTRLRAQQGLAHERPCLHRAPGCHQ